MTYKISPEQALANCGRMIQEGRMEAVKIEGDFGSAGKSLLSLRLLPLLPAKPRAVRDLPALEAMGFPVFAGSATVSHAYVHIIEFGQPVEVGGLTIRAGDLVHGDCHGVLSIPNQIATQIPAVADKIRQQEERIIALCRSHDFSIEKLRQAVSEEPRGER